MVGLTHGRFSWKTRLNNNYLLPQLLLKMLKNLAVILAFISSSSILKISAWRIISSISSWLGRFPFWSIFISLVEPLPFSTAETFKIPSELISKVTSIWGTPRGAGGMPVRSNLPKEIFNNSCSKTLKNPQILKNPQSLGKNPEILY